ncbi:MAG: translation initiation factor IF-2 [Synergistales bacterium]
MSLSKIRVYELAKMLEVSNKELMEILQALAVDVKTHMSSIDTDIAQILEETVRERRKKDVEAGKPAPVVEEAFQPETVEIPAGITIREVAERLNLGTAEVVKHLVTTGLMVPATARIDEATLSRIEELAGKHLKLMAEGEPIEEVPTITKKKAPAKGGIVDRPPIVTVMGHVDHGKTTLLDYIRKTAVAAKEAGGITQHIGASVVEHEGKKIVFLDTPGHEAFTSMRARGAQVTDIAILVCAADDGVMPQTVEALNHAKAAGVPIIVAVNKIDKPDARPDRVRQQLSDQGLIPEEWGGDTVFVDVSAKSGLGMDQLLEMTLLVAEMAELRANPAQDGEGVVVEAKLDKGKGPVATLIVQNGTLRRGDIVLCESTCGRVRGLLDDQGRWVVEAGPSTPVEVLGLDSLPNPGERFRKALNEREARDCIDSRNQALREAEKGTARRLTLEEFYQQLREGETHVFSLVLKCDVQGSLEALRGSLLKLGTDEVGINIVHEGVGRISESDVMLAAASKAVIIGFNVRPDSNAKKTAEAEGIEIRLYNIIYDVIDDIRSAMEGMLAPELREKILGQAEIRASFKVPKVGKIAGCYVLEGTIRRNGKIRLIRDGVVYWDGTLSSLKRFKDDAREVTNGFECGMSFTNFHDFKEGDHVECYEIVEEKRHFD